MLLLISTTYLLLQQHQEYIALFVSTKVWRNASGGGRSRDGRDIVNRAFQRSSGSGHRSVYEHDQRCSSQMRMGDYQITNLHSILLFCWAGLQWRASVTFIQDHLAAISRFPCLATGWLPLLTRTCMFPSTHLFAVPGSPTITSFTLPS